MPIESRFSLVLARRLDGWYVECATCNWTSTVPLQSASDIQAVKDDVQEHDRTRNQRNCPNRIINFVRKHFDELHLLHLKVDAGETDYSYESKTMRIDSGPSDFEFIVTELI